MKIPLLATWGNACTSISKQFAPSCSWIRTVIHHANWKGKYSQGNGRVKSQPPGNLMSVFMCRLLHHKQISHFNTTEQQRKTFDLWACGKNRMKKQHSCESQNLSCTLVKNKKALCYAFYLCWRWGSGWLHEEGTDNDWAISMYLIIS